MNLPWYNEPVHFHADSLAAGVTSFGASMAIASEHPPDPGMWHTFLPYLVSLTGPVLVLVTNRVLAAKAAKRRARAAALREDAKALLQDADPNNDCNARVLIREASVLEAEADALTDKKE
jgi:hypothetical protein